MPRLTKPRIAALQDQDWTPEQKEILTKGNPDRVLNVFRTMANHPDLMRRWLVFGNHILLKSTLSPRDREIAILRIGHLCKSDYEFAQHTVIGKRAGISDEEIERIKQGPAAKGWSALEQALLKAVDELHGDAFIKDDTWAALSKHYDTKQMMDVVFTVGQYAMVSMALNSFGVQLERTVQGPELPSHAYTGKS